ncbi:hypothetical protein LCGC14_1282600 [marine sediment metagenome]|uniref:Uncharacterized protein n=1 Tax=marine sediment metagenome TaxID=412755 RepID=A0A0F9LFU6_9ZZZZ
MDKIDESVKKFQEHVAQMGTLSPLEVDIAGLIKELHQLDRMVCADLGIEPTVKV